MRKGIGGLGEESGVEFPKARGVDSGRKLFHISAIANQVKRFEDGASDVHKRCPLRA